MASPPPDGAIHRLVVATSTIVSTVVVVPSMVRSTTNGVGPEDFRTSVTICSNVDTSVPPTLTTTSPAVMPAWAAGPVPVQVPSSPLMNSDLTQLVSPTIAAVGGCRLGKPHTMAMP